MFTLLQEKENVPLHDELKNLISETSRTPLQDVNIARSTRLAKVAMYSSTTPATPAKTTIRRRSQLLRLLTPQIQDGITGPDSAEKACVDRIVSKKLVAAVAKVEKKYEKQVEEKNQALRAKEAEIQALQTRVQEMAMLSCRGTPQEGAVRDFVDSIINSSLEKVQSAQDKFEAEWMTDDPTEEELDGFVAGVLKTAAQQLHQAQSNNQVSGKQSRHSHHVEPGMGHKEQENNKNYLHVVDELLAWCSSPSFSKRLAVTDIKLSNRAMEQNLHQVEKPACETSSPKDTCKTTPQHADGACGPQGRESHENVSLETVVPPLVWVNAGKSMSPISLKDIAVSTSPIRTNHVGQMTSPIHLTDAETVTSPPSTRSVNVMVTPVKLADVGQMTSPPVHKNTGTSTSPPPATISMGVMVTPIRTSHVDTMVTPIKITDFGQVTSPIPVHHQETAMTPPPSVKEASTATSPFCHGVDSPSQLSFKSTREISSQLETASVSNMLLRNELKRLQGEKEEAYRQLAQSNSQLHWRQEELTAMEGQMKQIENMAQAKVQRETADLNAKIADQQKKITDLEEAIENNKDEEEKIMKCLNQQLECLTREKKELQEDLCTSYKQKKQEIAALHEEYREKDYKPHFDQAQKTIAELEAQVLVYTNLGEPLEKAMNLQEKTFNRVTTLADLLHTEKQRNDDLHAEWKRRMEENDAKTVEAVKEYERILQENKQMCLVQTLYDEASLELQQASVAMVDLSKKVEELQKSLTESQQKCEDLESSLSQSRGAECASFLEAQSLQAAIKVQEQELEKQKDISEKNTQRLTELNSHLESECSRFDEEVLNLQRTLDFREKDIDSLSQELEKLRKVSRDQQLLINALEMEVELGKGLQSKLCSTTDQLENVQSAFNEMKDFLEEEQTSLKEDMVEKTALLEALQSELAATREAFDDEKSKRLCLQLTVNRLRNAEQSLEQELDNTKAQAHLLLLEQGGEISTALVSVSKLHSRMASLLEALQDRLHSWSTQNTSPPDCDQSSSAVEQGSHKPRKKERKESRKSLLSDVLAAISGTELPSPREDSEHGTGHQDQPESGDGHQGVNSLSTGLPKQASVTKPAIGSERSAFSRVQEKPNKTETSEDDAKSSQLESTSSGEGTNENDPDSQSSNQEQGDTEPDNCLSEQIEELYNMLGSIFRAMQTLEKYTSSHIQNLKDHIASLKAQAEKTESHNQKRMTRCGEEAEELRQQLGQAQVQESLLRAELKRRQQEINQWEKEMVTAKDKVTRMADHMSMLADNEAQMQKLKEEVLRLNKECQHKEAENRLLEETLNATLCAEGMHNERDHIREIVMLKKELTSVRQRMMRKDDAYEEKKVKVEKRILTLHHNWKMAEDELHRLDDIVDRIAQILEKHKDIEELNSLLMEISQAGQAEARSTTASPPLGSNATMANGSYCSKSTAL